MAGFAALPNEIARNTTISSHCKAILLVIASRAGQDGRWRMSQASLASEAGTSLATTKRSLKWLRDNKLVTVTKAGSGSGQGASFYELNFSIRYAPVMVVDHSEPVDAESDGVNDVPLAHSEPVLAHSELLLAHSELGDSSYRETIEEPLKKNLLEEPVENNQHGTGAAPEDSSATPTWHEHETELVESVLGALASLPPSMDSTTPDITGAKVFIRDGVEVLAADPTLAPGVVLPERKGWSPTPAALATARSVVALKDIPISIARYEVVKAEKREQPSSSEWLRWLLADEEKLKAEQVKTMTTSIKKRRWDSVAE